MDESPNQHSIIDAPYLPDLTALLTHSTVRSVQCVLGRVERVGDESVLEVFSMGKFRRHEQEWPKASDAESWSRMRRNFYDLQKCTGLLAGYLAYEAGFMFESGRWGSLPLEESGYAWRFVELPYWYEANHTAGTGRICATASATHADVDKFLTIINQVAPGRSDMKDKAMKLPLEQVAQFAELSQSDYEEKVRAIQNDIVAGRYYELNFTQQFRMASETSPAAVWTQLHQSHNPRHGFYANFGDEVVGSASPELFLSKHGRDLITRPIKGSLRGEISPDEQAKLDAEHIMVVDLARNDLGRVSDLRWVAVENMGSINTFGDLSHMESTIRGKTSLTWTEILSHTFPAASITGMPKIMVVQAIAEYENRPRGLYTGACGFIWPDGDIDLNVAIRTFTARSSVSGWTYTLGAGGAITADSDPTAEYGECLAKAKPLVEAILHEYSTEKGVNPA